MRAFLAVLMVTSGASCGGSSGKPADAAVADAILADARPDAFLPGVPDAAQMVRVNGQISEPGPGPGVTVTLMSPAPTQTTTPNSDGHFFFDVPDGASVVVKVERADLRPMIRAWRAGSNVRFREFYLVGRDEEAGVVKLGHTFDDSKAILEVDFRNAKVGGYGVTLTASPGGAAVTPGFGVAYDDNGDGKTSLVTVTGGDGSTLFLGNIPPGKVDLAPVVPQAATLPCRPCDTVPTTLEGGAVTWVDFECGTATDCL